MRAGRRWRCRSRSLPGCSLVAPIPTVVSGSITRNAMRRLDRGHRTALTRPSVRLSSRESSPSVHRPRSSSRPAGRAGAALDQPAVVLGQTDAGPVRGHRPELSGSRSAATRWRCSVRSARRGSTSWPADESFVERLDALAAELDDYLTRPLWYQQLAEAAADRQRDDRAPTASPTSRWSSASPRCCRTTRAAWASWPAIT